MKIKKITIENALSFGEGDDKLEIDLGDINFIVGPNNSGKTNVMRVIDHFRKSLESKASYTDHVEIMHDGNENRPFKIELKMDLDEEMKEIELFFEMLKLFTIEMIRMKNQKTEKGNIFESALTDSTGNEIPKEQVIERIIQFYQCLLDKTFPDLINAIFPNKTISLSLQFDGIPNSTPKLMILTAHEDVIIRDSKMTLSKDDSSNHRDLLTILTSAGYLEKLFENFLETGDVPITSRYLVDQVISEEKLSFTIGIQMGNIYFPQKSVILSKLNEAFPFVANQGYYILTNTIFPFIAKKIVPSDILRGFRGTNTLNEYLQYKETYDTTTSNLPSVLFDMKNSKNIGRQEAYENIRKQFLEKTGHQINVVSDINYTVYKEINDSQAVQSQTTEPIYFDGSLKLTMKEGIVEGAEGIIELRSIDNSGREFGFEKCGAGLFEILYFNVLVNSSDENAVIFLDEPAQNLHPRWQTEFLRKIENDENSKNKQFIITTHSPYLLPSELHTEMNLFYINKKECISTVSSVTIEDEDIRKSFERKKEVFFSDLNLLVEGPSDIIYIKYLLESLDEFNTMDIELIQCGGGGNVKKAHDQLTRWGIPSVAIVDADDKMEEGPSVMKLPCDVEGTIVLGDFLWELKNILKKDYKIKDEYQQLYPDKGKLKKNGLHLDQVFQRFRDFFNSANTSEELIGKLPLIVELPEDIEPDLETYKKSLFKKYNESKSKLESFIELKKQVDGKIDLANLIIQKNPENFNHSIPPQFKERIRKLLKKGTIESKIHKKGEGEDG